MKLNVRIPVFVFALIFLSAFQISICEQPRNSIGLTGGYLNASNSAHFEYSCLDSIYMGDFNSNSYFMGIS
ncbi:MAG: hypothetical protein WCR42_16385, partial [bacterium]